MKVTYNWKNFKKDKPKVDGKLLIIKFEFGVCLCKYLRKANEDGLPVYWFKGNMINVGSFSKGGRSSIPVYHPSEYDSGHDPYDFEWDYYEFNL